MLRRLRYFLLLLLLGATDPTPASGQSRVVVGDLVTEYKSNPIGIDTPQPRFSWKLEASSRSITQSAYQVRVAAADRDVRRGRNLIWDTDKVSSGQSIHIPYQGPELNSGRRYFWQVRTWDQEGRASNWSAPAFFETGLLSPEDWTARWIAPDLEEDLEVSSPSPMLRRTFTLDGQVASARAYVTSLGLYQLELNNEVVGDQVLAPGWTSYHNQIQYQTYDVTRLLRRGENVVAALLGDGWYRGFIGFEGQRNFYGDRLALLAQIEIVYTDGRRQTVTSDADWKASTGPILMSDIYNGETYDARLEQPGWAAPGFDDSGWTGVRLVDPPNARIVSPAGPPIRRVEEITPVALLTTPEGATVFDLGQNMVGRVRLRVQGPAGTTVTLRHAEVLDKDGNFYTTNLRAARQEVIYVLKGDGVEVYEPYFSFQGFRYVAVEGYPGEPEMDAITGVVIHSEMEPTGHFATSDSLINQLQHNIVWGQKGNFLDVPTDCPQRDERLGWTGDAQVFCRTAAFNYDVASFFTKWLADLAYDQYDNGSVPHVIPNVLAKDGKGQAGATAWADASTVVPWTMYQVYADKRLLATQYASMKAWVGYMRERAGDDHLWTGDSHFGDWLAFNTTRSDYPGATTSKDLIATAYLAHSSELVARAAEVLGLPEEAAEYRALGERVKRAFQREFVTESGRVGENTQTAYVLALSFDLLPEDLRPSAAARLADDVRRFGHLTTGFVGTPQLTHVLTDFGYLDVAYELLKRTEYPSWLYPVTQGATTIWERWDGQRPDGSFQDPGMNSFNHYAYGAVGDWMYRVIAGIDTDPSAPGYKHTIIAPKPGGGLSSAEAAFDSMYGTVASSWSIQNTAMTLSTVIPPNTTATIRLPGAELAIVTESGAPLSDAVGLTASRQDGSDVVVEAGSGRYVFSWPR